jgi:hypothetical protein
MGSPLRARRLMLAVDSVVQIVNKDGKTQIRTHACLRSMSETSGLKL